MIRNYFTLKLIKFKYLFRKFFFQLYNIYSSYSWGCSAGDERAILVLFSGGMGAQILSAAVYFQLLSEGKEAYADFKYFENIEHVAKVGNKGELSYWGWQLQSFGIQPCDFKKIPENIKFRNRLIIKNDANKLADAISALAKESIRNHFIDNEPINKIIPSEMQNNYLCIHIRRGDYYNVASHMVSNESFLKAANQFFDFVSGVVVISDSEIDENFQKELRSMYRKAIFLDGINVAESHRVMRRARILICSNSQFSLSAALLNPKGLIFLPKKWANDLNAGEIEAPISHSCTFQLLR